MSSCHQRGEEDAADCVCTALFFPGKFICPLPWLRLILVATSNLEPVREDCRGGIITRSSMLCDLTQELSKMFTLTSEAHSRI